MCPAKGKAICPLGSTTTVRSNFGSCKTEIFKVSPGFSVIWACAADAAMHKSSSAKRVRIPDSKQLDRGRATAAQLWTPPIVGARLRVSILKVATNQKIIFYKYLVI